MSVINTNHIAIVIPIHNRLSITREGLKCIYEAIAVYNEKGNSTCGYKVIVVDDGSTDGSSEWIAENYPDCGIVKGDGNLWWSGAINRGMEHAIDKLNSNWILLWNDDAVPADDYFLALEHLISTEDLSNVIVGSKILYKNNPDKIWSVGGYFNRLTGRYGMYSKVTQAGQFIPCDWLAGMGTLVPVSIIKKYDINWSEKEFPQYHGDSDFTLRCKRLGIKIVTCLNLVLYNNTETTGLTAKRTLKEAMKGVTSIRSNFNLRKFLLFYSVHGVFPIAYFGLCEKYFFYFGGFVKHLAADKNRVHQESPEKIKNKDTI